MNYIDKIFENPKVIKRIKNKLPKLFQIASLESSRAGKVGMEVGILREKIIVALLLYIYGEKNVETEISPTEPETDVFVMGNPISIKTKQGTVTSGIKLAWTVDSSSATSFLKTYSPKTDLLLVHINWKKIGGFYFFCKSVQQQVMEMIGKGNYIKLPKESTNSRGVEFSTLAINKLIEHKKSLKIEIE